LGRKQIAAPQFFGSPISAVRPKIGFKTGPVKYPAAAGGIRGFWLFKWT
jgi:hypothetical protein